MSIFLVVILLINVFIIGLLAPYLYRHAKEHFGRAKAHKVEVEIPEGEHIPEAVKQRLIKESEAKFQKALENSAIYLQHGLVATATDLNNLVKNLVTEIINSELADYHKEMDQMRHKAEGEMSAVKTEMDSHKDDLKAQLAKEIAEEKQKLIKQIDTKLGDAVGSFLVEALGQNVDLGSQNNYLTGLLEEHKAEFVKEVAGDDEALIQQPVTDDKPGESEKEAEHETDSAK